jgi:hypothetical protein
MLVLTKFDLPEGRPFVAVEKHVFLFILDVAMGKTTIRPHLMDEMMCAFKLQRDMVEYGELDLVGADGDKSDAKPHP